METPVIFTIGKRIRSTWFTLAVGLLTASGSQALDDSQVRKLKNECEAAREVELEPIRERRAEVCIEQRLRSPDHCRRYYKTYGNVSAMGARVPTAGMFYDLPECVAWRDASEALRASRSRN